jgi:hypothetical protein
MKTKERTIELLRSTKREGIEKLIQYLCDEGFFESPASTKYHGCYAGGLADHSLRVFELVQEYQNRLSVQDAKTPGQKPLELKDENIVIACLLHDLCKIGAYIEKEGQYKWNRSQPKGHATLSISRIEKFIRLEDIEKLMIWYHMGVYGLNEFYAEDDWQTGEYPLRGDHSQDESMTKEESQKARYGNSLANTWFHNPICKLVYFCDEISTWEQKEKSA